MENDRDSQSNKRRKGIVHAWH